MARPKKPINFQEELERIDMRLVHHQNSIKELEERESICSQKRQFDMNQLLNFMQEHNLSASDVINQIS